MPSPPALDLSVDEETDLRRTVQDILTFRDWLFANPEQRELVDQIYWDTCECNANLQANLRGLREADVRIVGSPATLLDLRVTDFDDPTGTARAEVIWQIERSTMIDTSGEIVEEQSNDPVRGIWLLRTEGEEIWKVEFAGGVFEQGSRT